MKTRVAILAVGLLLQVAVALARFLPALSSWWATQNTGSLFGAVSMLLSIHVVLLSATIGVLLLKESSDSQRTLALIEQRTRATSVALLPDEEFYQDFLVAMRAAKHTVAICYFAPYPPTDTTHKYRHKYYAEALEVMKRRGSVKFRRIIRDTPENRKWAISLLGESKAYSNIEIALLRDADETSDDPVALSVQIVDDERVWLVALGGHDRDGPYRDIYVESGEVGRAIKRYYARLWTRSSVLLQSGRLTAEGQKLLPNNG